MPRMMNPSPPAGLALLFLGALAGPGSAAHAAQHRGAASGMPGEDYVAGEVLVTFEEQASATARADAVRAKGDAMGAGPESRSSMKSVAVGSNRTVAEAVRAYRNDPDVRHAQPNYLYRAQRTPNDPHYDTLWGLNNRGQKVNGTHGTADRDIDAEGAWDTRTDCSPIPVAVIDTGINYEHADLAGNMWDGAPNHGRDFYGDNNDGDPLPDGGQFHGTHVAGIIGAVGNNDTATAGVCWEAEIMALRALGPDAVGSTADIIEAVDYARNNGARILNLSLAGTEGSEDDNFKDALAEAGEDGILVVAAAGNGNPGVDVDNNNARYPCSYELDNIICVAALDQDYGLPGWSNYGVDSVDIGAPGNDALASFPGPLVLTEFSEKWTLNEWATDTCQDSSLLIDPGDWCSSDSPSYANEAGHTTYRTFDLTDSALGAAYRYSIDYDLADSGDRLKEAYWAGQGDPFAEEGTVAREIQGETDSGLFTRSFTVPASCAGEQCSIGFRLETDASGTAEGVAVRDFRVQKVSQGTEAVAFLSGTSMAAPHVAGVAALVWADTPTADYGTVRQALLESGDPVDALDHKTVTGKAANAAAALSWSGDSGGSGSSGGGCVRNGGCTVGQRSSDFDPLWPAMLVLAWLWQRRSKGTRSGRSQ